MREEGGRQIQLKILIGRQKSYKNAILCQQKCLTLQSESAHSEVYTLTGVRCTQHLKFCKNLNDMKQIRKALVSVYHKDGLDELLAALHKNGVEFVSTGGTQAFIEGLGYKCEKVETLTTYPSILGGRVKTLHPKIFGGILGRRELDSDVAEMAHYDIPAIDLVIVDLYPFEETVASTTDEQAIIEKIDIGGISLIRAAAKNFADVVIVPEKAAYATLLDIVNKQGAQTTREQRKQFAKQAFAVSSHYDTAIHQYFASCTQAD